MKKKNQDTSLTGAVGEPLVLSHLLSGGILVTRAPRGAQPLDKTNLCFNFDNL